MPTEEPEEREKVELAAECCREILHHVNQAVRDMEDLLVSLGMAPGPGPQAGVCRRRPGPQLDHLRVTSDLEVKPSPWPVPLGVTV